MSPADRRLAHAVFPKPTDTTSGGRLNEGKQHNPGSALVYGTRNKL